MKIMNSAQLLHLGEYYPLDETRSLPVFRLDIYVPIFQKKVLIEAFNLPTIDAATNQMKLLVDTVNEILRFELDNVEWIKDEVWQHFNCYMMNSSYNMVDDSNFEDEEEANRAFFNVHNRNEAYQKVNLNMIHFDLNQSDRHFNLCFDCPWEDEHGISICIVNGKFDSIQ